MDISIKEIYQLKILRKGLKLQREREIRRIKH